MKDFLLEAHPNPERKGCPLDDVLKSLAEDRLPDGESVGRHVGSCSECYAEYQHYRQDWEEGRAARSPILAPTLLPGVVASPRPRGRIRTSLAVAAGILLSAGGGLLFYQHREHSATSVIASLPVVAHVDLFGTGTTRGSEADAMPLEEVALPSALLELTVILPRFSQSGPYQVIVSKDRAATQTIARATGSAMDANGRVEVHVTLDLRNAQAGSYFLGTIRDSDNGTYYYPLHVR